MERGKILDEVGSVSLQHKFWQKETDVRGYDHPVVSFFAKQRVDFISNHIPLKEIKDVLDVGSGRGYSGYYLTSDDFVTATDFAFTQLKKNPIKKRIVCKSDKLPFKEKSFSLVNEWELLHHLANPIDTVKEMARVTKEYLILFEPNRQNPGLLFFGLIKKEEKELLKHHKKMLLKLVENINFDVITCETVGWVFPNRMPEFILPFAKKLPFRLPIIGLSNVVICKRRK